MQQSIQQQSVQQQSIQQQLTQQQLIQQQVKEICIILFQYRRCFANFANNIKLY